MDSVRQIDLCSGYGVTHTLMNNKDIVGDT